MPVTTNNTLPSKTEWVFKPQWHIFSLDDQHKDGYLQAPNQTFKLYLTNIAGEKHYFRQYDQGNPEFIGRYELKIIRSSDVNGPLIDHHFFFNIDSKRPELVRFGLIDIKGSSDIYMILPSAGFHNAFWQAKKYYEEGIIEGIIKTVDYFSFQW